MSYEQSTYEELAKDTLQRMMCDIGEDCYCAGWMSMIEYLIWDAVCGGDKKLGMWEITESDVARMRHLHELAGGWWFWSEGDDDLRFVTTDEWLAILAKGRPEPRMWLLSASNPPRLL